jgi:tetratricopeptide (TPR) repeat protein
MKRRTYQVLFSVFICAVLVLFHGTVGYGQDSRAARWNEDIDYVIRHLEIMHPNLYANISREIFLGYAAQLKQKIPTSTDVEMISGIQELIARIRNTHTLCRPLIYVNFLEELKGQFQYYPVYYYPFEDGLYVVAAAERHRGILGKKVVKIGMLTTEQAINGLARFVAGDNQMAILGNIPRFFLNDAQLLRHIGAGNSPEKILLTLTTDDGSTSETEIEAVSPSGLSSANILSSRAETKNPTPLYLRNQRDNYWFEFLPGQEALYLQINLMNHKASEPFGVFCKRLFDTLDAKGARKLIIDVRSCPGGDHIELPLLKGILARPHIDRSDCLFLVIGRITGSAAEHLTAELKRYTNATLFGEPTGSKPNQYGAMQQFVLPNSRLEISCATKYFQDAEPSDYSMTSEPDIFVPRTWGNYRDNRDPVLERIASYDSYKQLRPEFFTAMSEAYAKGGTANLKQVYSSLKEKYERYGFNLETLLYRDLDSWIGNNQKSENDYIEFLKFIHTELPNSIPATYDLAYWMDKTGKKEEAKELYKRCIQLNPEHHHAKMRLGLIESD